MGALLAACRELAVVYNTLLKVKYLEYLTYTPHDFVVKFVVILPRFVWQQYLWNIAIQ